MLFRDLGVMLADSRSSSRRRQDLPLWAASGALHCLTLYLLLSSRGGVQLQHAAPDGAGGHRPVHRPNLPVHAGRRLHALDPVGGRAQWSTMPGRARGPEAALGGGGLAGLQRPAAAAPHPYQPSCCLRRAKPMTGWSTFPMRATWCWKRRLAAASS